MTVVLSDKWRLRIQERQNGWTNAIPCQSTYVLLVRVRHREKNAFAGSFTGLKAKTARATPVMRVSLLLCIFGWTSYISPF